MARVGRLPTTVVVLPTSRETVSSGSRVRCEQRYVALFASASINLDELEGNLDNKLLNLTLFDLRQKISELPTKEMKLKYISIIYDKIGMLQAEIEKTEKSLKSLL